MGLISNPALFLPEACVMFGLRVPCAVRFLPYGGASAGWSINILLDGLTCYYYSGETGLLYDVGLLSYRFLMKRSCL